MLNHLRHFLGHINKFLSGYRRKIMQHLIGEKVLIVSEKSNYWTTPEVAAKYERKTNGTTQGFDAAIKLLQADRTHWHFPQKPAVLDIGAGNGRFSRAVADFFQDDLDLTLADISEPLLKIAAKRVPNAKYVLANAFNLPFAEASYDIVTAWDLYVHFPDETELIGEAARVLKPHGRLLFNIGAGEYFDFFKNLRDPYRYTTNPKNTSKPFFCAVSDSVLRERAMSHKLRLLQSVPIRFFTPPWFGNSCEAILNTKKPGLINEIEAELSAIAPKFAAPYKICYFEKLS